ncbi:MAG TPA: hypothetical protein VNL77_17210 [Roseiflexaceae bacterium]|nr:hypothetical protein [Roseiflexaceae bacterium]
MTVVTISTRRPARALLLPAALVVALALLGLVYALGGPLPALLLVLLLLALLLLAPRLARATRAPRVRRTPIYTPCAQRVVALDDGAALRAIVAPVSQTDGQQLVLTARGYLLLDADGRVIYRLS